MSTWALRNHSLALMRSNLILKTVAAFAMWHGNVTESLLSRHWPSGKIPGLRRHTVYLQDTCAGVHTRLLKRSEKVLGLTRPFSRFIPYVFMSDSSGPRGVSVTGSASGPAAIRSDHPALRLRFDSLLPGRIRLAQRARWGRVKASGKKMHNLFQTK